MYIYIYILVHLFCLSFGGRSTVYSVVTWNFTQNWDSPMIHTTRFFLWQRPKLPVDFPLNLSDIPMATIRGLAAKLQFFDFVLRSHWARHIQDAHLNGGALAFFQTLSIEPIWICYVSRHTVILTFKLFGKSWVDHGWLVIIAVLYHLGIRLSWCVYISYIYIQIHTYIYHVYIYMQYIFLICTYIYIYICIIIYIQYRCHEIYVNIYGQTIWACPKLWDTRETCKIAVSMYGTNMIHGFWVPCFVDKTILSLWGHKAGQFIHSHSLLWVAQWMQTPSINQATNRNK